MPKPEFEQLTADILKKMYGTYGGSPAFARDIILAELRKLYVMGLNNAKEIVINHKCPNGYSCKEQIERDLEIEASRIKQNEP